MMNGLMGNLVFDVVLSVIGDDHEHLSFDSDFDTLDVDQLTITYIVLALESRLGIELPTHLENARTIAELAAGAQEALHQTISAQRRLALDMAVALPAAQPVPRHFVEVNMTPPRKWRPRRQSLGRGMRS